MFLSKTLFQVGRVHLGLWQTGGGEARSSILSLKEGGHVLWWHRRHTRPVWAEPADKPQAVIDIRFGNTTVLSRMVPSALAPYQLAVLPHS
jgi:hypothetical protein